MLFRIARLLASISGANIRIFFNTNAFRDKVQFVNMQKSMDYRVDFFFSKRC